MSEEKVEDLTYEALMEESKVMQELRALLALESGLSDWELRFAESVLRQYEESKSFTYKQENKIGELWDKHCG